MLKELLNTIKDLGKYLKYIFPVFFVLYLLSGIYTISQNEVGVLLRFGEIVNPSVGPGVNYHFPYPFERVIKAPIQRINTMVIDDFSDHYGIGSTPRKFYDLTGLASYCITGDNNIVGISLSIQYKIGDPSYYYFNINAPERLIYEVSANAVIKIMSVFDVDSILTFGQRGLGIAIRDKIQRDLQSLNAGVDVYFVDINYIRPPESVQSYFDDVINARILRENMLDQAESYRNTELLRASGVRSEILESARAKYTELINRTTGEADRFLKRREGLLNSREIVLRDIYLDSAARLLGKSKNLHIIDPDNQDDVSRLRLILKD